MGLPIWVWVFIGLVGVCICTPLLAITLIKARKHFEEKNVRGMLQRNEFLQPLDCNDYNTKPWEKMVDIEGNKKLLENLPKKIFSNKKIPEIRRENAGRK